jgi:hypothetical protein
MDDDQKWLEAAAAIEQDIIYLKAAVLGVYRTNAAKGVVFPHPDDLFCIRNLSYGTIQTATRRDFKAGAF